MEIGDLGLTGAVALFLAAEEHETGNESVIRLLHLGMADSVQGQIYR